MAFDSGRMRQIDHHLLLLHDDEDDIDVWNMRSSFALDTADTAKLGHILLADLGQVCWH